jgi:dihydrofolate reductase
MGRRTFESIGRPLPGRTNVVVSRRPGFAPPGVTVERSLEAALACAGADETFVIGGEVVFRQALPRADRVHLTLVDADVEGDVFFPPLDPREWRQISSEPRIADERHEYPFQFLVYDRILI